MFFWLDNIRLGFLVRERALHLNPRFGQCSIGARTSGASIACWGWEWGSRDWLALRWGRTLLPLGHEIIERK